MAGLGKAIIYCALLTTSCGNALSAKSNMIGMHGSDLYLNCSSEDALKISRCEGYILGVQDSIYSGHLSQHFSLCFPAAVTATQLRLQLIKFIQNNPDIMNYAAEGLVAKSLEMKFSCALQQPKPED